MEHESEGFDAIRTIQSLENLFSNSAINWEAILSAQYRSAFANPRTIIDVGAHKGAHTAHFLNMQAHSVVAFEPIRELATALLQYKTEYPQLIVHQVALSDASGRAKFTINRSILGQSGLRAQRAHAPSDGLEIEVDLATLDSFNISDVDLIKIDAEGAELTILSGAEITIGASRPLIALEYGLAGYNLYGHERGSLLNWAMSRSYLVCDLFGAPLVGAVYNQCVDRFYWDYFLVPAERHALVNSLRENGKKLLSEICRYTIAYETLAEARTAAEAKFASSQVELSRSQAETTRAQNELQRVAASLTAMRNSNSWRLTKPLRQLRRIISGPRPK
jgi:FkbM family methyltransferase